MSVSLRQSKIDKLTWGGVESGAQIGKTWRIEKRCRRRNVYTFWPQPTQTEQKHYYMREILNDAIF